MASGTGGRPELPFRNTSLGGSMGNRYGGRCRRAGQVLLGAAVLLAAVPTIAPAADAAPGDPVITVGPANVTVTAGQTSTFTAQGTGVVSVLWQKSVDSGANWTDITSGVTTSTTAGVT